ncbi:MAG: fibronectin type III domain-containing protein [Syntrophobacteraceae bacterium]
MAGKTMITVAFAIFFIATAAWAMGGGAGGTGVGSPVELLMPDPPGDVTATAGNGQATVSFTPPKSDGGSPITYYTVRSRAGGITVKSAKSPIVVKGLTNGTAYTFTVTASNSVGTGLHSSPSNSVTPRAE